MPIIINPHLSGLRCTGCGAAFGVDEAPYTCPKCGANLDAAYDYAAIARAIGPSTIAGTPDRSAWHYRALLPFSRRRWG